MERMLFLNESIDGSLITERIDQSQSCVKKKERPNTPLGYAWTYNFGFGDFAAHYILSGAR